MCCKHCNPAHWQMSEQAAVAPQIARFEGTQAFFFEAATPDSGRKPTIDREKNLLIGVRAMNAKPTRKDYFYGLEAQKAVATKYEGMIVGVDHDYKQGPPTIERSFGKVAKSYTDDLGTLFDVQFNPAHARTEQILKDAETGLNTISLSCITTNCRQEGKEVKSFEPAGVDFVVNAGQTTKMFEQADKSGATPATPSADAVAFEQMRTELAALKSKVTLLEQVQPAAVATDVQRMEQNLKTRGVDLDKFHDDFLKAKA